MEEKRFINRKDELKVLISALERKGAELIILYGRRRIGKSRLLRQVSKKVKIDVLVMLEEADYAVNLKKVAEAVVEKFDFPAFSPSSFKELFKALPKGCVVALDEYSYISSSIGEFQSIWEEIAKPKKMKVILCGSLIRVMEDLNYSLKSPLYGRATQIIKLMSLSVSEVRKWYGKRIKAEDILSIYFCLGGIPRYLEIIKTPSLEEIKKALFSKDGLLLREGKLFLKESFPTSVLLPKILFTVASGNSEATKIANTVEIKANEIGKYLSILTDYGFVEKRYPVLGGGKKDVRFYPADKFLSFWTRFVWSYYSEIENGFAKQALLNFEKQLATFSGFEFEKTILEFLQQESGVIPFKFSKIGRQWGRVPQKYHPERGKDQYEIDILALNEETKEMFFAECKWQSKVKPLQVVSELNRKTEFIDLYLGKRKITLAVFAKSFAEKISEFKGKKVLCFDLQDLNL